MPDLKRYWLTAPHPDEDFPLVRLYQNKQWASRLIARMNSEYAAFMPLPYIKSEIMVLPQPTIISVFLALKEISLWALSRWQLPLDERILEMLGGIVELLCISVPPRSYPRCAFLNSNLFKVLKAATEADDYHCWWLFLKMVAEGFPERRGKVPSLHCFTSCIPDFDPMDKATQAFFEQPATKEFLNYISEKRYLTPIPTNYVIKVRLPTRAPLAL